MRLTVFDWAGLVTHGVVLALGLGGIVGAVPLPRGRRSGSGLVLMAVSMVVLLVAGRRPPAGLVPALVHVVTFAFALWLLIGPVRRRRLAEEGR